MQKISLFVAALFALLFFGSCKKDSSNRPSNCSNTTNWARNGHQFVYVNDPIYIFADSMYVSMEEVSSGVFKSTSRFDDGSMYPSLINFIQPCNNSVYQGSSANMDNKQEVYRNDGTVGDTWSFTSTTTGGTSVTTTTTIIAKNVSVSVEAGTFTCLHLRAVSVPSNGSGTVETDYFLNNDAGIVKVDGTTASYELARKNY